MYISQDIKVYNEEDFMEFIKANKIIHLEGTLLFFVKNGTMLIKYRNSTITLQPNSVYVITRLNTYEVLSISPDIQMRILRMNPTDKNTIANFSRFDIYQMASAVYKEAFIIDEKKFESLWEVLNLLRNKLQQPKTEFYNAIVSHLYSVVLFAYLEVMSNYFALAQKTNKRKEDLAIEFLKLLKTQFILHHSVDFYADQFNVTPKYLTQILKEVTGNTPKMLISKSLITEAKKLLITSHSSISAISDQLNFPDVYSFSKFFKKYTDFTPSEYRKAYFG